MKMERRGQITPAVVILLVLGGVGNTAGQANTLCEQFGLGQCRDWCQQGEADWGSANILCPPALTARKLCCRQVPRMPGSVVTTAPPWPTQGTTPTPYAPEGGYFSAWSACSVSCGQGLRQRVWVCTLPSCFQQPPQVEACQGPPCAEWSIWSPFGRCSLTCGGGFKQRRRVCYYPESSPDLALPTPSCPGLDTEVTSCNDFPCPDLACGRRDWVGGRLYQGEMAARCAWPWFVHFEMKLANVTTCAGVLLDPNSVLTTAQCGKNLARLQNPILGLRVTVGDYDRTEEGDGLVLEPSGILFHPGYTRRNTIELDPIFTANDFAVVQLKEKITLGACRNYACLPDQSRQLDMTGCRVLSFGNGATDPGSASVPTPTRSLQEVAAMLNNPEFCQGAFAFYPDVPNNFSAEFQCGSRPRQYSLCTGDESSLLLCGDVATGQWSVAGLGRLSPTTNAKVCSNPAAPPVYIRVFTALDWVRDIIARNN